MQIEKEKEMEMIIMEKGWILCWFVTYYKGWPDIDSRGMQYVDWKSLDSLNLELLNWNLLKLLAGEEVLVPEYDMKTSMPCEESKWVKTQLPEGGIIIMEGIHCLNPALTPRVEKSDK